MLETFTHELFAEQLNTHFRLYADPEHDFEVELIEAAQLSDSTSPPLPAGQSRRTPFSLVFRSAPSLRLPQSIYRLQHEQIGSFELFLVPIGPDQSGMRYQAIFT